jgi:hemerythrin
MKLKDFIAEHRKLIKILNKGTKAQQRKEAKDQAAELLRMLKKPTLK